MDEFSMRQFPQTTVETSPAGDRMQFITVITPEQIRRWNDALVRYKSGKANRDARAKSAENWWKMRNSYEEGKDTDNNPNQWGFQAKSGWLHNVIVSKHADYMEAFPRPNVLARGREDQITAWFLAKIIPVILSRCQFEKTYSDCGWQKIREGGSIYKIIYDRELMHGMGDINVLRRDALNVFWEPGIEEIQDSRYVFDVEEMDKEVLLEMYPFLEDRQLDSVIRPEQKPKDDITTETEKVAVIDVYYKKRGKVHYCKYVGNTVIYASEDDHEPTAQPDVDHVTGQIIAVHDRATDGMFDHGLYPYVVDVLYPVSGQVTGYGFIDVNANTQTRIDLMSQCLLENAIVSCSPRYFETADSDINREEFLNVRNKLVKVNTLNQERMPKPIETVPLNGNHLGYMDMLVQELRETSGNTEAANGITSGVTAAAAIAAQQQASGKGSKDLIMATYRAYQQICYMIIELIRQFYDMPRQFRITGERGVEKYISFSNEKMKPQWQGIIGEIDQGYYVPQFDVEVVPEKSDRYSRMAQNELAFQLYGAGFFIPDNADQALACAEMMDFDSKDDVMQKIANNGTLQQKLLMWQQLALELANKYEPGMVQGLAQEITGQPMQHTAAPMNAAASQAAAETGGESRITAQARAQADAASQPGGAA